MNFLKQFTIPFAGLKTGKHRYHFIITKEFLIHYNIQEINDINCELDFSLDKQSTMLTLHFMLDGKVETLCDRCGDNLSIPVFSDQELYIKFGQAGGEENEKIVIIPVSETEIDISQYIYEFITFAIPFKKVHPEGGCNPESIKKLKEIKIEQEKKEMDPRWKELLKLKLS